METGGEGKEQKEEEVVLDWNDFIQTYSTKDDIPIIAQIKEAITFKDPTVVYEFVIDYRFVDKVMKKYIMSLGDFNLFSKEFSDAVKTVIFRENRNLHREIEDVNIKVRFKNFLYDWDKNQFPNLIPIRSINSGMMDKYLCFRGIIRNIVTNQNNIRKQKFRCLNCKNIMVLDFNDLDRSFNGNKCSNTDCNSEELEMIKTKGGTTNVQVLTIEELANDSEKDTDSVTVTIDGNLVNKFSLGDTVIVTGNYRLDVYNDTVINQFKKKTTDLKLYKHLSIYGGPTNGLFVNAFIEANFVEKISDNNIMFNNISREELKEIKHLSTDHHLIDKLVQSFAPDIYGYETEKEVLIYQLIGGAGRSTDPELDKRGEIHVFFIGDSGTAKSELMKWSLGIAHRCRFVYAGNMTKVGISGGAEHDSATGKWVLTAGTAVVADKGLLGIDELNHAPPEILKILNEIMENQTTTITKIKSGSFNTRVAVLASANPPDGNRYNKNRTFMQNLGINVSLFTRFDYIGLFRDIPNPEIDPLIAEKIIKSYQKANIPPVRRELLAKYIFYAKNNTKEIKFTKEAEEEIIRYYNKIRTLDFNENIKHPTEQERVSITARQIETMLRFAVARTRLYLRNVVDKDDVERGEKIIDELLRKVGVDPETGQIDASILNGAKPRGEMSRDTIFFGLLEKMAPSFDNTINCDFFYDELRKQPKWSKEDYDDIKLENYVKKLEKQQNIIVVNDKISLTNYNVSNSRKD